MWTFMSSSRRVMAVATALAARCSYVGGSSTGLRVTEIEVLINNGSATEGPDVIAMLQQSASVWSSGRGAGVRKASALSTETVEAGSDAQWLERLVAAQAGRLSSQTGEIWPGANLGTSLSTIKSLAEKSLLANEKAEIAARAYTLAKARAEQYAKQAQTAADVVVVKSNEAIENSGDAAAAAQHLTAPSTQAVLPSSAEDATAAAEKAARAAANATDAINAYKAAEKEAKADSLVMLNAAKSIVGYLNETIQKSGQVATSLGEVLLSTPIPLTTTTTPKATTYIPTTTQQPFVKTEAQPKGLQERQQPTSMWTTNGVVILSVVAAVLLGLACWCYNKPLSR